MIGHTLRYVDLASVGGKGAIIRPKLMTKTDFIYSRASKCGGREE